MRLTLYVAASAFALGFVLYLTLWALGGFASSLMGAG